MENIDEATTSKNEFHNDNDNENNENYKNLTTEELAVKVNSFRNLCIGNKINTLNAFDIDMIGHFSIWLKKRRQTNSDDVKMFQEIADFLETSGKIYSYRVDNLSETTSKLVEQFRTKNYKESILNDDNEKEPLKMQKPKRLKLMLTTSEKLNRKSSVTIDSIDSDNKQDGCNKINFNKLFETTSRPSNYMLSLYSNTSLAEDIKKSNVKRKENYKEDVHAMDDIQSKIIKKGVLCPEFNNFITDHDKIQNSDSEEPQEPLLDGIEDHFDVNDHPFMDLKSGSVNGTENCDDFDSNDAPTVNELIDCVDEVNRDYSFFNPVLLANWKGPKVWKTQAMVKALKSSNPSEQNDILNDIDKLSHETIIEPKTKKKSNKVNVSKIKWSTITEIDAFIKKNTVSQEKLAPRTLIKWTTLANICDTKSIVVDLTHKLSSLEYVDIYPDWWKQECNTDNIVKRENQSPVSFLNNEDINDYQETFEHHDMSETIIKDDIKLENIDEIKTENPEDLDFKKLNMSHSDEEDNFDENNFRTETKMDIGELKKEIHTIIEQECVKIDSKSEWSTRLSFLNLLNKLRVTERKELSIAIIFVSLLHLTNEYGLKLFQEHGTIDDGIEIPSEIFIAKPMKSLT